MSKKILDEDFVKNKVINWLSDRGYNRGFQIKTKGEHGIDIKVRHRRYARYYIVEAKGEPSKKVKYPASIRENSFLIALGQIITRMRPKAKYWYALAFPESFSNKVLKRLPWGICKKLRLKILFINKKGKVRCVTWKEIKKAQR